MERYFFELVKSDPKKYHPRFLTAVEGHMANQLKKAEEKFEKETIAWEKTQKGPEPVLELPEQNLEVELERNIKSLIKTADVGGTKKVTFKGNLFREADEKEQEQLANGTLTASNPEITKICVAKKLIERHLPGHEHRFPATYHLSLYAVTVMPRPRSIV